jgi:hypothetical protein
MKLILSLSSLIHRHIIKSVYMTVYLMTMKSLLRLALSYRYFILRVIRMRNARKRVL